MWLDDENQQNQNQQNQGLNQPSVGAGGGVSQPTGTTGNPSTITPVQSHQPAQQFATVQDYLKSNKPQGEKLGEAFTGRLNTSATNEQNTIGQAATQTKSDIATNTPAYDANLVSEAVATPTSVANDPNKLSSFINQWNASYKGPASFESSANYTPAAQAANEAAQKGQEVATTGGRQQLLKDEFGVRGSGNQGLDQAILQTSSYFPKVQESANTFKSVGDYLQNQSNDISTQAQTAQKAADDAKANTQNAFTGALSGFQTDLSGRTKTAQDQASQAIAKYKTDLQSGDPDTITKDLKESGVDDATAKSIVDYITSLSKNYGIKPDIQSSLIGNPATDITNANVATSDDYQKAQALQKLTGVDYSGVLNPADAAKANTGTVQNTAFKTPAVSSYLKNQLQIQDKSALSSTPTLNWDDVNSGKTGSDAATKTVQDIIDAGKRQGIDPHKNPALDSIHSNAMQGLQAIILGRENINSRPVAKTYADAAVAAMIGKGETEQTAKAYVNKWVVDLGKQVGIQNEPPIYK